MIAVGGKAGGQGTPENFRIVKLVMLGIAASDKDPADSITGAVRKPALALLIEARVLVEQGRKDRSRHKVFNGAVGISRSKAFAITFSALTVARFAVFCLTDPRQHTVPGHLHVIERTAGHDFEFLPGGEWRDMGTTF